MPRWRKRRCYHVGGKRDLRPSSLNPIRPAKLSIWATYLPAGQKVHIFNSKPVFLFVRFFPLKPYRWSWNVRLIGWDLRTRLTRCLALIVSNWNSKYSLNRTKEINTPIQYALLAVHCSLCSPFNLPFEMFPWWIKMKATTCQNYIENLAVSMMNFHSTNERKCSKLYSANSLANLWWPGFASAEKFNSCRGRYRRLKNINRMIL